ncbi:MAG: PspC domain-containing protein [Nocardioides sp.]|nr:PspC domain-containing protein [Nocardioides sp.]
MNDIHQTFARNGRIRPRDRRVLGGVCSGLGRRIGLDPWPARLLFLLALMVLPGSQLLVYPILWILMPAEEDVAYLRPTPPTAPAPPTQAG